MFIYFQYVTEKMGGAEGTKLDIDFVEMERVTMFQLYFGFLACWYIPATGYPLQWNTSHHFNK